MRTTSNLLETRRSDLQEIAETVDYMEVEQPKKDNPHFIEANTKEVDLQYLKSDCIVPVFSKDNDLLFLMQTLLRLFGMQLIHSLMVNLSTNQILEFRTLSKVVFQKLFTNQ